jgi:2-isopropylmalate synthase
MNLFSQGVDPRIDFSQIDEIRRTAEYCNQMEIHPRHPYAGDLVYTAFSGSHQDAIKKGFEAMEADATVAGKTVDEIPWAVPYLPIDPKDVGRSYEAVIRVNSQSGKGGVAYVLKNEHKLDLPRRMQIEFSKIIQAKTDTEGGEITPEDIWSVFEDEYLPTPGNPWGRVMLRSAQTSTSSDGKDALTVEAVVDGAETVLRGTGNGPISAFFDALAAIGIDARLLDYSEHTLSEGASAQAASYIECAIDGKVLWGIGVDPNTTRASLQAVVSAVNRAAR